VLPLRDLNPTKRTPFITVALVIACTGIWVFWQQEPSRQPVDDLMFNLEYAAIPCELLQHRPLTDQEIAATFSALGSDHHACTAGSPDSTPAFPGKQVLLAVVLSMFFHGNLLHIGGNMLFLWIFGNNIEDHLGALRFLAFYLVGGVVATLTHVALQPDSTLPLVGASGAVAAVMGASLVWFPDAPVRTVTFLGSIVFTTIRAKWLLAVWFIVQFFTSPNSGIGWAVHVGGAAFGVTVGLIIRTSRTVRHAWFRGTYRDQMDQGWDGTGGAGNISSDRP
jgi:membrane associated rhomboid family serine protease